MNTYDLAMNAKKSVRIKAEISKDDMINLYLDLIIIWTYSKDKDRKKKIDEYVKVLRGLTIWLGDLCVIIVPIQYQLYVIANAKNIIIMRLKNEVWNYTK